MFSTGFATKDQIWFISMSPDTSDLLIISKHLWVAQAPEIIYSVPSLFTGDRDH